MLYLNRYHMLNMLNIYLKIAVLNTPQINKERPQTPWDLQ